MNSIDNTQTQSSEETGEAMENMGDAENTENIENTENTENTASGDNASDINEAQEAEEAAATDAPLDFSGLEGNANVTVEENVVEEDVVEEELETKDESTSKETEIFADPEKSSRDDELVYELPSEEEGVGETAAPPSPYDRPGKWYVISINSGQEKLAKSNLETRIQTMNVANRIFEVVVPLEEQVEFKGTKKEVVQKKLFPGYILVRCHLDDETWLVISKTPSVTAFIGAGTKPVPLKREEVDSFLGEKGDGQQVQKKIRPRLRYEIGETVRVKEGPFTDFQGEVTEINEDQLKVKLLLNIFGRETPVELEFSQVAKQ